MKMDRLIGILSILLQRERVTAPELAEQFEVSRRTIQRDIESLCRAGIPIATAQGAGGGISIMEGYRVDRTVLTAPEMQAILAGLDLGIAPATSAANGTLTARFEKPTLRIVAFDPKAGTARVRIIPAEGATVARPLATGVLHVRAAEALGVAMAPLEAEVDASGWLGADTKGEATLTFRLGRNLFIKVVAERPATQTDTEKE